MYQYINNGVELKEVRIAVETILKNVQKSFLRQYFTFQFNLIGSGAIKLITKNGDNGDYDLDYNLIIQKDKKFLINDPKKIKELFIQAFNESNPKLGFKPAENSTSVITSKLIYDNRFHFSFDVAILCQGNNGNYLKIVYNKPTNRYYWNEVKMSRNYRMLIKEVKKKGNWGKLRNRYLELKNDYLFKGENIESFSILIQALNEIKG